MHNLYAAPQCINATIACDAGVAAGRIIALLNASQPDPHKRAKLPVPRNLYRHRRKMLVAIRISSGSVRTPSFALSWVHVLVFTVL